VKYWLLLFVAIIAEVIATTMLKSTEGFTHLWPSLIVITCYEIAFLLLAIEFIFRMHRLSRAQRAPRPDAVSAS